MSCSSCCGQRVATASFGHVSTNPSQQSRELLSFCPQFVDLAAFLSLPLAPQPCDWLHAEDACTQFCEKQVKTSGSTYSGSFGLARVTTGQSVTDWMDFYRHKNQEEPGKSVWWDLGVGWLPDLSFLRTEEGGGMLVKLGTEATRVPLGRQAPGGSAQQAALPSRQFFSARKWR